MSFAETTTPPERFPKFSLHLETAFLGEKLMFCTPIPHSSGSDSLIRANDAIDDMTLKQLGTGIL